MDDIDVLIIGAGPTGGMLALELAMQGIKFRIIDKEPVRSDKSRALVLHPRSLELLDRHGIARDLIALGKVALGVWIFVHKKLVVEFDLQDLGFDDTAFPTPLFISQADTETFLDDVLRRYGHAVERPVTAEKLEQDSTGVTAWLRGVDGIEQQVRCKYVVGCDGAHSIVRHSANLSFDGAAYPQDFILADVHVEWEHPSDRLTLFMGQGLLLGFPMRDGIFRLISSRPGGPQLAEPTLADFQTAFTQMAPGEAKLVDPTWVTRFRLHHRGVNHYRAGRMFVAGDAAHIHSPVGGQGMNTGIQDAVNLGWKLALVLRGEKDDSLLDSYDLERHRVGDLLLRTTDRAFQYVAATNPVFLFLRNLLVPWVVPWVVKTRSRRARLFRFMSELGIRYRSSPIVGSPSNYRGKIIHGGDRAPDGTLQSAEGPTTLLALCRGPTHHLILFSGTGSNAVDEEMCHRSAHSFLKTNSDLVKVHTILTATSLGSSGYLDEEGRIHARYGFTEPGYALVRPDGYVAQIGPLTAMDEFQMWVSPRTPISRSGQKGKWERLYKWLRLDSVASALFSRKPTAPEMSPLLSSD